MKIHVLPADKQSRLIRNHSNKSLKNDRKWMYRKKFNIYITDDSEIKKDEWCIDNSNEVFKFKKFMHYNYYRKIILTTDKYLIDDGVEKISEDILLKIVEHIKSGKDIKPFYDKINEI